MRKIIGSFLMLLGICIGAGMLALPVVTAHETFTMSMVLLFSAWLLMTIGALSMLEVNLWCAADSNMITMAGKTIGGWGKSITWVVYLLLLYSVMCAYLSGLSDVIQSLLANIHIIIPRWSATVIGLGLFSVIVYRGIGSVDVVTRGLMSLKLIAYVILVSLLSIHINMQPIFQGDFHWRDGAFMVMLTSFGFATIVPSLRTYLNSDKVLLKRIVVVGSLLPLIVYALWIFVIQGIIPKTGADGLVRMSTSAHTNSMLMHGIALTVHATWLSDIAKLFISICALTSFLVVSICLMDFIADGLNVKKQGKTGILVYAICFFPPLFVVLLAPGVFVSALDYAGIFCLILLVLIPVLMLYFGRYRLGIKETLMLPGGKVVVVAALLVAFVLLVFQLLAFL